MAEVRRKLLAARKRRRKKIKRDAMLARVSKVAKHIKKPQAQRKGG